MSILYPVAASAEAALNAPLGRAAREREAQALAGAAVTFATEEAGPAFSSRDAALDAFAGRVEDDRDGRLKSVAAEDRFLTLRQVVVRQGGRVPVLTTVRPSFADGRRWPRPTAEAPATVWRAMVAYWKLVGDAPALDQARIARKNAGAAELPRDALKAMASAPLRPVQPQRALDIGLFETPLPEAPGRLIADE